MKKTLFFFFLMFSLNSMCQTFQLTPEGFTDSANIERNFIIKEYNGKTQEQLFKAALLSVGRIFISPKDVISKVENSQISLYGIITNVTSRHPLGMNLPFDMTFNLVLEFKDGKMKINSPRIINIKQQGLFDVEILLKKNGSGNYIYLFKKNGKLAEKKHKESIEKATNSLIKRIIDGMNDNNNDSW